MQNYLLHDRALDDSLRIWLHWMLRILTNPVIWVWRKGKSSLFTNQACVGLLEISYSILLILTELNKFTNISHFNWQRLSSLWDGLLFGFPTGPIAYIGRLFKWCASFLAPYYNLLFSFLPPFSFASAAIVTKEIWEHWEGRIINHYVCCYFLTRITAKFLPWKWLS